MAQSASQAITGNNLFQQSIYVSSSDDLINLLVGINAVTINKKYFYFGGYCHCR